ncbi:acyltransferase-domain-containing protein [Cristinia sonorae]|uniref:Acyltransferase-domain-containing protein n=1 Tax=Cristinia sonorae TaxID=1940300 RepID=A0A8K0UQS9_9AGAR|nr:acyltransferase-domain-containing protein [Cristinia sonorae]
MGDIAGLHNLPITERPKKTWRQTLNALLFIIIFDLGCLMINGFQFTVLLPLKLIPFSFGRRWYSEGIRYSKGAFGTLLLLICQWFAPTKFVITFEKAGLGRFTEEEIARLVIRDETGRIVQLKLPPKSVLIANHQMYADWLYAWCLSYFTGTHKDIFIVLKKSLKWAPIIGWGMQFFNFIFLARSWASDRIELSTRLAWLGRRAEKEDTPLTFILYPEGTLVSKDTRPISKKYADKIGVPDMSHTLLPRSTGLHYSLRSLSPRIPNLELIDITMAYPGIPPFGYGQSYYTLRSIFCDRLPPPVIYMHIRKFNVAAHVPIGDISAMDPDKIPAGNSSTKHQPVEVEIPEAEREKFDLWLRELWREKDKGLARYHETGSLADDAKAVEIPLELRSKPEILDAFCFFIPALMGWLYSTVS